jgi:transposase
VAHVARQLGLPHKVVKRWVDAADAKRDPLMTERERIRRLEKENEELKRSNEILQAAAHFFRAELDRRPKP